MNVIFQGNARTPGVLWDVVRSSGLRLSVSRFYPRDPARPVVIRVGSHEFPAADQHNPHAHP